MYYHNCLSKIINCFVKIKEFIINKRNNILLIVNDNNSKSNIYLQCIYLSISILSTLSVFNKFQLINCSNVVGLMCLIDFFYIKKRAMIVHHIFVLMMIQYMNTHHNILIRENIISVVLSTEISTIFLITNSLLSNNYISDFVLKINCYLVTIIKNINSILFIYTFLYYRVYNYYYNLIIDKETNIVFLKYSKNIYEFYEIYISIYGLFILNLYWSVLIFIKFSSLLDYSKLCKSIKSINKTKNM
jgi:hypothetical protein